MMRVCARASRHMQGFVAASVCAPECRMSEITARAQRVTSLSRGEGEENGGAPSGERQRADATGLAGHGRARDGAWFLLLRSGIAARALP
jgi:hypothetical protein